MNVLSIFEQRISAIFEEGAPGQRKPFSFKRLAKRAVREMEDETFVIDGIDTAPALYTVLVSAQDDALMRPMYVHICDEIAQLVEAQAKKRGYTFVGRPLVRFMTDPALRNGRFSVFAENVDPRTLARLRDEENAYLGITTPQGMPDQGVVPDFVPVEEEEPAPIASEVAFVEDELELGPIDEAPMDEPPAASAEEEGLPEIDEVAEVEDLPTFDEVPEVDDLPAIDEVADNTPSHGLGELPAFEESDAPVDRPSSARRKVQLNVGDIAEDEAAPAVSVPAPVVPAPEAAEPQDDLAAPDDRPASARRRVELNIADLAEDEPASATAEQHDAEAEAPLDEAPLDESETDDELSAVTSDSMRSARQAYDLSVIPEAIPTTRAPYEAAAVRSANDDVTAATAPETRVITTRPQRDTCTLTDVATGRTYQIIVRRTPIGRERVAGGIVLHDPNVSRRHAELVFENNMWQIRDLNSTNGTLVDDMDVQEAILADGDVITIGLTNLEFRAG